MHEVGEALDGNFTANPVGFHKYVVTITAEMLGKV